MLDQVKLRYMLEQFGLLTKEIFFYNTLKNYAYSHCLNTYFFVIQTMVKIYKKKKRFIIKTKFLVIFSVAKTNFLSFAYSLNNKFFVLGALKNLLSRTNQQVTKALNIDSKQVATCLVQENPIENYKKANGTSETTREAVSRFNFDFSLYMPFKPTHITNIDIKFLTWFVGFVEGDGSFWARQSNSNYNNIVVIDDIEIDLTLIPQRGEFEITQSIKNVKLLFLIKKKLGFGRIISFSHENKKYYKWYTSKKENIIRLIHILNGNLVLEKRRLQFTKWLLKLNQAWFLNIPEIISNCTVSLNDGWLSGFSDADAGFYTNILQDFKGSKKSDGTHYVKFSTKYYITQLGELPVLEKIKTLVNATTKIGTITNGKTQTLYNRLEINDSNCNEILITYFTEFPLKGIRKIASLRWARVHAYKALHLVVTQREAIKLARLVSNLQEPANEFPLRNLANNFSKEELNIFSNLPLSQRHPTYVKKKP
uniref:Putative LAGLIDADG homing endonuclease n=1 Tax=Chlamydomonas nivalis TaxID=47906 RepID=A0A0S2IAM3_9CHLO|nr:putative LAGLIDADG homing endonuclease [Chlamydomonas nivalis]